MTKKLIRFFENVRLKNRKADLSLVTDEVSSFAEFNATPLKNKLKNSDDVFKAFSSNDKHFISRENFSDSPMKSKHHSEASLKDFYQVSFCLISGTIMQLAAAKASSTSQTPCRRFAKIGEQYSRR